MNQIDKVKKILEDGEWEVQDATPEDMGIVTRFVNCQQETIINQQKEIAEWKMQLSEYNTLLKISEKKNSWISVKNELPKIGQIVLLLTDDTVQNETYMYDESDIDDWNICQFWSRDDIDNNKILNMLDMWQPLPLKNKLD
jgi:hypothetical protein